jgi:autotransporter family porin
VLSDAAAAEHVRHAGEIRPDNATANHTVPTGQQLADFRSASKEPYTSRVTGNFVGSTDEIIQWAAWKWGVDEDVMRAVAVLESDWNQDMVGDGGVTFGLMQIKTQLAGGDNGWPGTFPLARDSTPFNADYYGRAFRSCYDGRESWLGGGYRSGDGWGCVGCWFSGDWHDSGAEEYISSVKQFLADRDWEKPDF